MNVNTADWAPAWLWLAVIASGLYHGLNPGMGWPLAVSAGLMERSPRALVAALGPLAAGHLLAMLLVILPFALLVALVEWQRTIQVGASLLVIAFGLYLLVNRRHPRALARITSMSREDGRPPAAQSAATSARGLLSISPAETASGQPIPGLTP